MYAVSQEALYSDWKHRLLAFPILIALGTGIAWNNTRAVVSGLLRHKSEFRRTPKFGRGWQKSNYALRKDRNIWVEILLAVYAFWGMWLALQTQNIAIAPYLGVYSFSFGLVAFWSLRDRWQLSRRVQQL